MGSWHFLVDRNDFRSTLLLEQVPEPIDDGQIRVRVDAFGFTANNVTYAAAGDMIGYWNFFPAPDLGDGTEWGRIPVWGFSEVVESRVDDVQVGERLYGYLPMSSELTMTPIRVGNGALTDGSEHRSSLPPVYNRYVRCAADPGYDPGLESEQMIYRPLFTTSFLIDDFIADHDMFGASTVVLASASSKTAFGAAQLLHRREGLTVTGLTSPVNVDFVEGLGCYDRVVTYDDIGSLPRTPVTFVDMSGNASVVRAVHEHYGDNLRASMIVGLTHWEDRTQGSTEPLPGPEPTLFFAPTQGEKRIADWGRAVFEQKLAAAWPPFIEEAGRRVSIQHSSGADAVGAVYHEVMEGATAPDTAHVLHP